MRRDAAAVWASTPAANERKEDADAEGPSPMVKWKRMKMKRERR